MFKQFLNYLRTPTHTEIAEATLAQAKRELMDALTTLEAYEGKIVGLNKTIARLEGYKHAPTMEKAPFGYRVATRPVDESSLTPST